MSIERTALAVFLELQRLQIDYWHDVDHQQGCGAEKFYAQGGIFELGPRVMIGRAEIGAFYRWRAGLGDRLSRHCISNPRLVHWADGLGVFECILHLFVETGKPVLESKPAAMIADVRSECEQVEGIWHFKRNCVIPLFTRGAGLAIPPREDLVG